MRKIKNKIIITKNKTMNLYNLLKKEIDFDSEIINSKELKKLEMIVEIKEALDDILYEIIYYKNS